MCTLGLASETLNNLLIVCVFLLFFDRMLQGATAKERTGGRHDAWGVKTDESLHCRKNK